MLAQASLLVTLTFFSMGTLWKIDLYEPHQSVEKSLLTGTLLKVVNEYDQVFSDWNEQSELRQLEKRDLTQWQEASPLFLQGLGFAQEAYQATDRVFDITIGAVLWKELSKPVGLSLLQTKPGAFRFKEHPKRLTFGGIVKGAAVGALAKTLFEKGFRHFRIDAGGGNLALAGRAGKFAWEEEEQIGRLPLEKLAVISRSHKRTPKGEAHILLPFSPSLDEKEEKKEPVLVVCLADFKDAVHWDKVSAHADALSTALVLKKIRCPQTCHCPP